jgi:hypothetical protein
MKRLTHACPRRRSVCATVVHSENFCKRPPLEFSSRNLKFGPIKHFVAKTGNHAIFKNGGDRSPLRQAGRAGESLSEADLLRRFAHNLRHEPGFFYFLARNPLKRLDSKK